MSQATESAEALTANRVLERVALAEGGGMLVAIV